MLYHVSRNGQTYGPYTLEDLQRYVASGNVLPTDMARADEASEWVAVSEVLRASLPPLQAATPVAPYNGGPGGNGGAYTPAPGAAYPAGGSPFSDPPNLHWAIVLVIGIFTCGLFIIAWDIVQAVWMRRVNPRSNALYLYIAGDVLSFGGNFARFGMMATSGFHNPHIWIGLPVGLFTFVLIEFARFDMRRSMEEHFNGAEAIGLSLSGVMTFFFGSLYFQYHMTRINEYKRMARYRGAAM